MEKWSGRYNRQQMIFMARATAYVLTLRESLTRNNEIDWNQLPDNFPVLGPKFIPPSLQSLALTRRSLSYYYLQSFTMVDPQLYQPDHYTRKNMCAHAPHTVGDGIQRKDLTYPKQCYGMHGMEWVIGITHNCVGCKKLSTTSSHEFWDKIAYFKRPGNHEDVSRSLWLNRFKHGFPFFGRNIHTPLMS